MNPTSHTLPRRSLRQQGQSPESGSVISPSTNSQSNPTTTIPATNNTAFSINSQPHISQVPIFASTMSHDRAHFHTRRHDIAPSQFVYDTTQNPNVQRISQPIPRHHTPTIQTMPTSHATTNVIPPHESTTDSPDENGNVKNNSTNSIINNAEHIIQEGNNISSSSSGGNLLYYLDEYGIVFRIAGPSSSTTYSNTATPFLFSHDS